MFFARSDWFPIQEYPRIFPAHMTAHEIDNMASRFPEAQTSEIYEKAIPINTKKATKFGLSVFQGKVLILNIILRVNFRGEAEIVSLTRNNCPFRVCLQISKYGIKIQRLYVFSSPIHWSVYVNVIIHLSVGEKPSIFTSPHSRLGEYPGLFTSTPVYNCSLARESESIRFLEISTLSSLYMLMVDIHRLMTDQKAQRVLLTC